MTQLESGFDPGAVSFKFKVENGPDFGMCQINLHFNPKVSLDQAFDPAFALKWSARRLSDALRRFSGKGPELQEQCAVAYHNSPVRAQQWYDTGQPPTEQIEEYVRLVLERAETFPEL
jgi:soluble lytic murein transglycosylase-like protein